MSLFLLNITKICIFIKKDSILFVFIAIDRHQNQFDIGLIIQTLEEY